MLEDLELVLELSVSEAVLDTPEQEEPLVTEAALEAFEQDIGEGKADTNDLDTEEGHDNIAALAEEETRLEEVGKNAEIVDAWSGKKVKPL